jgi:hypothetical protein
MKGNTMQKTKQWHTPIPGSSYESKDEWLTQRRGGVTATEVRELARGGGAAKREIILEKLVGGGKDLSGNRYVNHGNKREPIIAAYLEANFDIAPEDRVWSGENVRHLASPDGVSSDFAFDRITSEIKTSKHDLTPGDVVDRVFIGKPSGHFASTGYYDQIQWQMHVMGGERVLFAWEQHDDNWPDPAPIHDRPQWCWILRDQRRIDALVDVADKFLAEISTATVDSLAPVGEIDVDPLTVDLVHQLLAHRDAETIAKRLKENVWKQLQTKLMPTETSADDVRFDLSEASVSVSTSTKGGNVVDVVDYEAMARKSPSLVQKYADLVARNTIQKTQPTTTSTSLTVVAKKIKEITE